LHIQTLENPGEKGEKRPFPLGFRAKELACLGGRRAKPASPPNMDSIQPQIPKGAEDHKQNNL